MRPDSLPWIFTGGFGAFVILLAAFEQAGMGAVPVAALLLAGSVAALAAAGMARVCAPLPAGGLGSGIAWIGGAFLLAWPGILFAAALDGLALLAGAAAGMALVSRRREVGTLQGTAAAVAGIALFLFAAANLGAGARVISLLLGLGAELAAGLAFLALIAVFLPGGAAADQSRRTGQYIIALLAILVPAVVVGARFTGMPVPQLALAEVMRRILETERAAGPAAVPFLQGQDMGGLALLALAMMLGLLALPMLAGGGTEERRASARWGLLFGAVLLATLPVPAAFMRSEIDGNVIGRTVAALPAWVGEWSRPGRSLVAVCDAPGPALCPPEGGNADGLVQAHELKLQPDVVLLAAADLGTLPPVLTALIAAGVLAAALAAAGTALRTTPAAFARGPAWLLAGGFCAAGLAASGIASPFRLALFALTLAGAALAPRALGRGGEAGVAVGAACCLLVVGATEFAGPAVHDLAGGLAPLATIDGRAVARPFGYDNIAFGILGAAAGWLAGRITGRRARA